MSKKNEAWGIDLGSNAIKAIKLGRSGNDVRVLDFAVLPFKHVLTMPDLNVDEMVQVQLDTLIQKYDIEKSTVVTAVPGNMAFARFAKLPPVEPKKIPDIVRFEAQQQIPFPIEQVEWDYQVFSQADSPDVEVGIFAITKERVMTFLENYRNVNIDVDALTLSPLAVYNAFQYDNAGVDSGEGVVYMDIGTVSTDVIIVEEDGIWLRTLPIGGNNFTEALVKQFKISFLKAEKLKREAATSKYAKQIFQAMRAVFADLVQEVQRSLGFYQSMNRDSNLTKLIGVGSTFRLPGLQKFIKQQLQIEVVRPDSFERLEVEGKREAEFAGHALNFATAYGLALQGLGHDKVSANILPSHILASRVWRSKQPWIAASAACFVIAAGLVGAKYFMDRSAYISNADENRQYINNVINKANAQANLWSEIEQESDPRQSIENLRRVLDHRNVMSSLLEDLTSGILALDPQEELLGSDYEAFKSINRSDRRRIYLDSITFDYEPLPKTEQSSTGTSSASSSTSLESIASSNPTLQTFFTEESAPRFLVTIKGTTPLSQPDIFLNDRLIEWLKANADDPTRPYRFEFDAGNPIRSLTEVTVTSAATPTKPETMPPSGFSSPTPFRTSQPTPRRNATSNAGQSELSSISALLPKRPDAIEDRKGDWEFEIQWYAVLRTPQEARPKVTTPSQQDNLENDGTPPGNEPTTDQQANLGSTETDR
jgi:type IV pilus assembly protein PilM